MVGALVLVVAAGCTTRSRRSSPPIGWSTAPSSVPGATTSSTTSTTTTTIADPIVEVAYRVEDRVGEPEFAAAVDATLTDPRGWQQAGFRLVQRDDAPFAVVLATPSDAQRLCRPYDVYRRYSCQNGPVVVLNVDRWRSATPEWTGDLGTYRQMLVNHEVGHLLGLHHPDVQCPTPGRPAPVMAQQSTELNGCLPNPWPLPEEIDRAARHDLPLAPPYER